MVAPTERADRTIQRTDARSRLGGHALQSGVRLVHPGHPVERADDDQVERDRAFYLAQGTEGPHRLVLPIQRYHLVLVDRERLTGATWQEAERHELSYLTAERNLGGCLVGPPYRSHQRNESDQGDAGVRCDAHAGEPIGGPSDHSRVPAGSRRRIRVGGPSCERAPPSIAR